MIRSVRLLGAVVTSVLLMTLSAIGAKSPAMEACSGQWGKMKEAKTIPEGQTWPKYWSQCSKDYAAAHASETTTDQATTAPEETTATTTTKKAKKSTRTAAVNEDEPAGSSGADKKACDG